MAERTGAVNKRLLDRSVEMVPQVSRDGAGEITSGLPITMLIASVADDITPWGPGQSVARDRQLRAFWPQESTFASALYGVCASNAALTWELDGPPASVGAAQEMLHDSNFGQGWTHLITQMCIDLLTQDNGAFIEMIRASDSETSPVLGIQNLDAAKCRRTGDPRTPVIYWDQKNVPHRLRWYQVITLAEFPSPLHRARGLQYSALTRILRAAQIFRSLDLYIDEKISGRNPKAVHFVSAIDGEKVSDAIRQAKEHADDQGLTRYMDPIVVAGLDPTQEIRVSTIELAGLPDHFDMDVYMRRYINGLSMGFGRDYQDFAPLPSGGIGSGAQSQVLRRKTRAKGIGQFMKLVSHAMNWSGVLPRNVQFRYTEPDAEREAEEEAARKDRAERHKIYVDTTITTPEVSQQILQEAGDLPDDIAKMMGTPSGSSHVQVSEEEETTTGGSRADDEDPKDRDARQAFADQTNAYQDKLVRTMRKWTQQVTQDLGPLEPQQARERLGPLLEELRREMVALGEAELPKAYRLAAPARELGTTDLETIDTAVARNTQFIQESLVPYAREKVEAAITQAEELRAAADGS